MNLIFSPLKQIGLNSKWKKKRRHLYLENTQKHQLLENLK